jgi:hypothetical protein
LVFVGNLANAPRTEDVIMKLGKMSVLTSAAWLAASVSMAMAQSTMAPRTGNAPAAAANQGKCWDSASNRIMDKSANSNQTASGARNPGGVATGAAPTGSASSTTGSAQARPPEAAGLPNC